MTFGFAYPRMEGAPVHPYDSLAGDVKQQAIAYFNYMAAMGVPIHELEKDPAYKEQFVADEDLRT